MRTVSRSPLRRRTLPQLVRQSLRSWGSDRSWRAISELHLRGDPATLSLVRRLCAGDSWRRRALGLHVASQLLRRDGAAPFGRSEYALEETQALLRVGLKDAHDEVIGAAVSGLGHRPHPAALTELVRLSTHSNARLRFGVAVALGRYGKPAAIDALIALAADSDDAVRDWATFGLGSMQEADTPAIRDALWTNVHDHDEDVRGEALCGLAARHDPRATDFLVETLNGECRVYQLDAAETLASPRLLEPLQRIASELTSNESKGYWFNCLKAAISACSAPA